MYINALCVYLNMIHAWTQRHDMVATPALDERYVEQERGAVINSYPQYGNTCLKIDGGYKMQAGGFRWIISSEAPSFEMRPSPDPLGGLDVYLSPKDKNIPVIVQRSYRLVFSAVTCQHLRVVRTTLQPGASIELTSDDTNGPIDQIQCDNKHLCALKMSNILVVIRRQGADELSEPLPDGYTVPYRRTPAGACVITSGEDTTALELQVIIYSRPTGVLPWGSLDLSCLIPSQNPPLIGPAIWTKFVPVDFDEIYALLRKHCVYNAGVVAATVRQIFPQARSMNRGRPLDECMARLHDRISRLELHITRG